MSRETVACVTGHPAFARASASSSWLPMRRRETTLVINRCRSPLFKGVTVASGLAESSSGNDPSMLRKLLWTGLYAGLAAGATMAARRAASGIWRVATGESPPVKK